jgi:glycopeptide antibiotics resistance protein
MVRPDRRSRNHWVWLPVVLYAVALLLVVFWPVPVDRHAGATLRQWLDLLHSIQFPDWFDYALVEWLANIVMFTPFGFFAAWLLPWRHWWLVLPAGFAASVLIEACQAAFLPERFASPADVQANTLGTAAGLLACALVRIPGAWRRRRRRRGGRA